MSVSNFGSENKVKDPDRCILGVQLPKIFWGATSFTEGRYSIPTPFRSIAVFILFHLFEGVVNTDQIEVHTRDIGFALKDTRVVSVRKK